MRSNKITNILRNEYVISVFIKILMLVIGMLHSAFLARFLGTELKGVAATVTSTVALLQVIITCGIHQAYPYFKKEGKIDRFKEVFINNVYFIYLLLLALIIVVALEYGSSFSLKYIFILLLTPLFAYENVVSYVYLIENPVKKNLWSLYSAFFETLFIIFLWLFTNPNNFNMVLAISIAVLVRAISSTIGLGVKPDITQISVRFVIKMLRYGLLPMLALILTVMNSKIDILMMDWNGSVTSASIGLYSVGVGVADKILAIPDAIREILLSKLVSGKSEQEVARVTRLSVFFCVIVAIGIALFGKLILQILYGAAYLGAYNVLVISSCGTVFMVFLKMISQYNIVNRRQLANLLMLALSVITNMLFNVILIPHYGIEGAAIASFLGHFVCAICFISYFAKTTSFGLKKILLPQKEDFGILLRRNT